ncbi:hypothetical protein [Turicibacter sanguinis]|uniref:hypothetical protein n=1 Tax=Turicibacter sanguinis TaxID=154288 RepID=UPI0018A90EFF|nr:hypothetical protein [Turicibacter sanguinis]MDB8553265.1 hypothetical protein [Turicibacter sanguinis]
MKFVYFDGKHINKDKVHYIEKYKITVKNEDVYRVCIYLDLGEVVDFFSESFQSEEKANERYYEILGHLNS